MKVTLHCNGNPLLIEYTQKDNEFEAVIDGKTLTAKLLSIRDNSLTLLVNDTPLRIHVAQDGQRSLVAIEGRVYEFTYAQERQDGRVGKSEAKKFDPTVRSPMPGKILQILVEEGERVEADQTLVLLEAMKMENALMAEGAARIKKIHVSSGDLVDLGQTLIELEFITPEEGQS